MEAQRALVPLRDRVGAQLRSNRLVIAAEILVVPLAWVLNAAGILPMSKIPLLVFGWLSLWLRRSGWRDLGLDRPKSWPRTVLLGAGFALAYGALDLLVLYPLLTRVTGEPLDLGILQGAGDSVAALLGWIALSWVYAALAEELLYRGYILNRLIDFFGRGMVATVLAVLVAGLGFGYVHGYQGLSGLIGAVLCGIAYGVLYLASGRNLWACVMAHGVQNTVGLILIALGVLP